MPDEQPKQPKRKEYTVLITKNTVAAHKVVMRGEEIKLPVAEADYLCKLGKAVDVNDKDALAGAQKKIKDQESAEKKATVA